MNHWYTLGIRDGQVDEANSAILRLGVAIENVMQGART